MESIHRVRTHEGDEDGWHKEVLSMTRTARAASRRHGNAGSLTRVCEHAPSESIRMRPAYGNGGRELF
jgi:hypothetical protein